MKFYTTDELRIEEIFGAPQYNNYYNREYDFEKFKQQYFSPWVEDPDLSIQQIRQRANFQIHFDAATRLTERDCFGGNYRPLPPEFQWELVNNTQAANFPNRRALGIIVASCHVRQLPTDEYCFVKVRNAGEGYPFDYFQQTSLWIGTPVLILQVSRDGMWQFVVSPYGKGWVKTEQVASVTNSQRSYLLSQSYACITRDNILLKMEERTEKGFIGMILPIADSRPTVEQGLTLFFPIAGEKQRLFLREVTLKNDEAQIMPLTFNSSNISSILEEMLDHKYSWGGIDGGRDCSSNIKDFLTPFGIWMPRNSFQQAAVGQVIELQGTPDEKLLTIRQKGIPFLTVIYKPGHSMLYAGIDRNNHHLIFHNVWGLKPVFFDPRLDEVANNREAYGIFGLSPGDAGISSRFIIGKAVVTAVNPEKDFENVKFDAFIDNISSMNVVVQE